MRRIYMTATQAFPLYSTLPCYSLTPCNQDVGRHMLEDQEEEDILWDRVLFQEDPPNSPGHHRRLLAGDDVVEAHLSSTCGYTFDGKGLVIPSGISLLNDLAELPHLQHKGAPGEAIQYCKQTRASVLHRQSLEVDTAFHDLSDAFHVYESHLHIRESSLDTPNIDTDKLRGRLIRVSLGACHIGSSRYGSAAGSTKGGNIR
ncbi:unnamed protein product, partial [Discosporangium mesarthrocarpum]